MRYTPTGTAEHDESVVGRVNLKRVRRWCDNSNITYKEPLDSDTQDQDKHNVDNSSCADGDQGGMHSTPSLYKET